MSTINVCNLTKDYKNGKGIFNLNFTVKTGEVYGYLGPNGAGKTTTIRHLMGFLSADKGNCSIGNYDCRKDSAIIQKDLGYLPGETAFFDDMNGIEFLTFMANLRGLNDLTKMRELISFFELDTSGRIKKMSKGMKQKIGIVSAFMHNPSTLVLDEPTSGLDPLMQSKFVSLVQDEKKNGKTILMSSHSFEEVERTCDRVGIIKQGRIVCEKTVDILKKSGRKKYVVSLQSQEDANVFATEPIEIVGIYENQVTVAISDNFNAFIKVLGKYNIVGLNAVEQSLEDIFMAYYGGRNDD